MKDVFAFLFHVITGRFKMAFEAVRHLNPVTQVAFLGLGLGSYAVHQYPKQLWLAAERGYYVASLQISNPADRIPLSATALKRLDQHIATLEHDQIVELRRRNLGIGAGYNAWAVAQMVVGLGPAMPVPVKELKAYFDATIDRGCNCWRETPQSHPHTGATGWIVYAQSKLSMKTDPAVLDFLLSMQSPDGWWPLFPAKPEPVNAASYPTAWASLALCSQTPLLHDATEPRRERARFAVENALNWLSKNEVEARWRDYPANTPSISSVSITGLVLHTYRMCGYTDGVAALHGRWLDQLPFDIASASESEISNTNLYLLNDGLEFDRTRHYVLEWTMIGIVDAYRSGSVRQRAAALQWLERVLALNLVNPEVRNQRWIAAELQYALRHLKSHAAPSDAKPATLPAAGQTRS